MTQIFPDFRVRPGPGGSATFLPAWRAIKAVWRRSNWASAPVLTLMMVSVIDIGMGVHRKMQVEDAAQVGAQYAMRNGFDANAISNAVIKATNFSAIVASPAPVQFCGCATVPASVL